MTAATSNADRRPALAPDPAHLDPAERMSLDELRALQLERLQDTLRRAYANVPHYRRAFAAAGVHPDDCRELADLARFPTMSKADLRDNYPFGMFAVPQDQVCRVHASSGTTGRPTVVGYTAADIDTWATVMARSIRAAGGRPGDRLHNAYGYGLFTGGLGAHYGAEKLGCMVIPVSGGQTSRQVQLIGDFRPRIIMVTPSYMLTIIDEFEKQGLDPKASSLEIGIFGAEPWTEQMRQEMEERAGIQAVDIYGLSEVMGPGVSQECVETKDGLHIWEDHFYPEVIDPLTGAALPAGDMGELVFTSLTKQALPVIRYRTRDLTRLLPGTARPGMRRMEKITGRDRRHDHPAGGESLPHPDRGDRAADPGAVAALRPGADHPRPDGPPHGPDRGAPRLPGDAPAGRRRPGRAGGQGERRDQRGGARRGSGDAGPLGRQAAAALRPAGTSLTAAVRASPARRGRPGHSLESLLAVSVAVFNERGYDATSMEDLAARLGITKSAIYHHVPSKVELLRLALDRALDGLFAVTGEPGAGTGPAVDRLEYIVRGSVRVLASELPFVTLLLRVRGNSPVELAALRRRREFDQLVTDLVRAAAQAGDIRPDVDPAVVSRLLFGTVNSLTEWYRPNRTLDAAALADAVVAVTFDGLRVTSG